MNIITGKFNPFRTDVGDVADFFSFNKEFLGRTFTPRQKNVLSKIWNTKDIEKWNTDYHIVALMIGMKGGKNFILESDVAYTLYYLSCLKDKWAFFSKAAKRQIPYPEDTNFDIGNASSVGANQAKRAFFSKVKNVIRIAKDPRTNDSWFERYAKLDIRETFGNLSAEKIEFPTDIPGQGAIRLYSFNSEPASPEGLHFFKFYFDEPSRANTKRKYIEAAAVAKLGENNTRVSFPNRVGKFLSWAYPNETDFDLMVDLYERSFKDDSVFGERCTTFDFNLSITKEMLEDAYKNDPIEAARIYECIKPASKQNLYHPRTTKLKEVVNKKLDNRVSYLITPLQRKVDTGETFDFTSIELLDVDGDKKQRCFAGDYSVNGDRLVLVGGYNQTIDATKMKLFVDDSFKVLDTNVKPVIDVIIVIEAISASKPIDYLSLGNILTALKEAFPNMVSFNTDKYQNEKLRQELIYMGVSGKSYSFSRKQQFQIYTKKRWCVWNNNLEVCNDTKKEHLLKVGSKELSPTDLWVLEGEKLIRDGEKIDHPEQYSKDVQDAIAIVINDLLKLETEGVIGMTSTMEQLSDEKFMELVTKFMDEKYMIIQGNSELPESEILEKLEIAMSLNSADIKILAKYVKEQYNY